MLKQQFTDPLEYQTKRQEYQRELAVQGLMVDEALGWDEIRNPVVKKALNEVRRLVNELIDKCCGRPACIYVELAREARGSIKERRERKEKNDRLDRARKKYAEELVGQLGVEDANRLGIVPSRRLRRDMELRYELYKAMRPPVRCIYCGKTGEGQSLAAIFEDGLYQIDHVAPYSISFRDAKDNLVLACADCNRTKGNRLPYEAFANAPDKDYNAILQRVKAMDTPYAESLLARFQKDYVIDADESATRHLNDTRYIARQARAYLGLLYPESDKKNVRVSSGGVTAELRKSWGLNRLLLKHNEPLNQYLELQYVRQLEEAKIKQAEDPAAKITWPRKPSPEFKCRGDRRHHAIDAIVLAVTTPELVKRHAWFEEQRAEAKERGRDVRREFMRLDEPWTGFILEIDALIPQINISYAHENRNRCGLHSQQPQDRAALDKGKGYVASSSAVPVLRSNREPGYFDIGEQHHVVFFRRTKARKQTTALTAPRADEYECLCIHKMVTYKRARAGKALICKDYLQNLNDFGIRTEDLNEAALKWCNSWEYVGHMEQGELFRFYNAPTDDMDSEDAGHIPARLKQWPHGIWRFNGMSRPVFVLPKGSTPDSKSNLKLGAHEYKFFAQYNSSSLPKPEDNPLMLRVRKNPVVQFQRIARVLLDRTGQAIESRRPIK